MLAARSGRLREVALVLQTLINLSGEDNCTVQCGGSRVGNHQVPNMVRQPLQEDVSEGFRGPPAVSGQDLELYGKVHDRQKRLGRILGRTLFVAPQQTPGKIGRQESAAPTPLPPPQLGSASEVGDGVHNLGCF